MASCSIYLIRHGLAAEQGAEYPSDEARPLTSEGIARMRAIVAGLKALDVSLDRVMTSPLVRCAQTADLVAEGLGCAAPVVVDALRPGGRYDAVLAALARPGTGRSVALVGHMPSIGEIAAGLIGARAPLAFKKGGVCCIETATLPPSGLGALMWFMPPRALRALGQ